MKHKRTPLPPTLSLRWLDTRHVFLSSFYSVLEHQLKFVPPAILSSYETMLLDLSNAQDRLEEVQAWYRRIEEGKLS